MGDWIDGLFSCTPVLVGSQPKYPSEQARRAGETVVSLPFGVKSVDTEIEICD